MKRAGLPRVLSTTVLACGLIAAGAAAAQTADTACKLDAPDAAQSGPDCAAAWMDRNLHLNDVQAIGTHNSYKMAIPAEELAAHRARDAAGADSLDYAHEPLHQQLELGARVLELDVYYDPKGGRYAHPPGASRRGYGEAGPWPAPVAAQMAQPGFKVMHLADIDFRSQCMVFVQCLQQIRAWSQNHREHAPILILINAKDGKSGPGAAAPLAFDGKAFDALDAEIRSVFAAGELIVPDTVRGQAKTLREAVIAGGWPSLGEARGKMVFALDEDARKVGLYRGARRSLEGRAMFVNGDENAADAAYLTLNDPIAQGERIARAVEAGFLVRTRADADTVEARHNDSRRREAAFASGAQYISTDYLKPDLRFSRYRVTFPRSEVVRCNPLRAMDRCGQRAIEAAEKHD
ncbi:MULTISPECIES: phosphatidylinositol-specific phospholipase C1-like protein [unclassified Lysobacter]|uniref:phosphatidylinositol-specific phospholipase C1-like protein n=1 Tax=unclassified Lysobacter TaxID=2635362 RepID=UPI001BEC0755|nr:MULTISPECIES: phosphatidylinositol-specific phospholipase C1-like protein [unclassified Lysobacter]MBT2749140.1 phosphatidylinositol-specific phospholipase C1-like protein [Lysobacter sp. ISL-42]MBT2753266.1 phosphatidylinositol-specific phospholipase C1-like protein [Lysobacter sp. ISL-50]MBT2776559.1 phosphatidylinositol-specific phospholipase C1-like protein [Lysobacter sp. ISL-54]MBT2783276.1 phosphatidylinositol-specific phospholipase C1-like protein [Lysobacter sp. ISL-52]